jgi:hypothetical protein
MWFAGWRSAKRERRYFCAGGKSQRVPALTTKVVAERHVRPSRLSLEFDPFNYGGDLENIFIRQGKER